MANREDFEDREAWLSYQKSYRDKNRKRIQEINKKWRDKNGHSWDKLNPLALLAHQKVKRAVTKGILIRQPCESCGSTEQNRAHHDDYSKLLDVRWFCEKHHREHHNRLKLST